jgi:uncharacterized membrane protein affecting hemolysin expression
MSSYYGARQSQRRVRRTFIAAWVFLVVVVAFGFYVQARTINRIEQDEQIVADLVRQTDKQQTMNAEQLCGLLVIIDEKDRTLIIGAFQNMGYRCTVPADTGA